MQQNKLALSEAMEQTQGRKDENGVYIVIENETKSSKERYKRKSIKIMSVLHLICGFVSFAVEIVDMLATPNYKVDEPIIALGEGFYCGFIFLVTGLIGITSLKRTNSCKISAFLVLSILSSIFGGVMFIMSCMYALSPLWNHNPGNKMFFILIICGFFELVLGIVSSSFSCHACCVCCGGGDGEVGGNSVVYVATPGEAELGKPRVVHLDMNELKKKTSIIGEKQIVLTRKQQPHDNNEDQSETKANKGYARFE